MAISCGKKARKLGGGNRFAIKRAYRRGSGAGPYRDTKERVQEHLAYVEGRKGRKH